MNKKNISLQRAMVLRHIPFYLKKTHSRLIKGENLSNPAPITSFQEPYNSIILRLHFLGRV